MNHWIERAKAAELLLVNKGTLQSWIYQGLLHVNESQQLDYKELTEFAKRRGMPIAALVGKKNILVVDDDESFRLFVQEALHECDVFLAGNGVEALMVLDHQKMDLILLDIRMPSINGLDFLRIMHTKETFMKIPIIVCSAQLNEVLKHDLLNQENVVQTLEKPVRLLTLLSEVGLRC